MGLNTISYNDFVSLEEIDWIEQQKSLKLSARASGLFKEGTWEPGTGEIKKYDEIDGQEYARIKHEGDEAEQALFQEGYEKTASPYRMALETKITWEMRRRNKYQSAITRLTNLRRQVVNRLDLDMTHRITFGTATSYTNLDGESVDTTIGDGKALFATDHTLRGSSTTYTNILAGNPQVSRTALEGIAKLGVEQTFNQFGEKMAMDFDILYTADDPNTINTVRELLQSTGSLTAEANSGVINVDNGRYKHVVLYRLATTANGGVDSTKATIWGIASSMASTAYMDIEEEPNLKTPTSGTNLEDPYTDDWIFSARGSWSICVVGAKWIKFSDGSGS